MRITVEEEPANAKLKGHTSRLFSKWNGETTVVGWLEEIWLANSPVLRLVVVEIPLFTMVFFF